MRSYGQFCSIAKALDVVGDRWSLLIIRELSIRDGLRYTDLKDGLPGIATNLLADRIRELEAAGLIRREEAPPPVATTLFHLTQAGRELRPSLDAVSELRSAGTVASLEIAESEVELQLAPATTTPDLILDGETRLILGMFIGL